MFLEIKERIKNVSNIDENLKIYYFLVFYYKRFEDHNHYDKKVNLALWKKISF